MAANRLTEQQQQQDEAYSPFSFPSDSTAPFRFGFLDSSDCPHNNSNKQQQLPPPPPSVEVLPSEASFAAKANVDTVVVAEGLTLLKGRVNTSDVFGVSNSDLVPGKYEGGLKLWEGSLDLIKTLRSEAEKGQLVFRGKRVLELGCGHGLPGIFTGLQGAAIVHFQDFNVEVLRYLTIPNMNANLGKMKSIQKKGYKDQEDTGISFNARFFAGDWRDIHHVLMEKNDEHQKTDMEIMSLGYDIILMAETFYSISSIQHLYDLTKKCLGHPHGVVYLAGKKHYFGVGGGTSHFLHVVDEDGVMDASLITQIADGSSNVREVWKLSFRSSKNAVTTGGATSLPP